MQNHLIPQMADMQDASLSSYPPLTAFYFTAFEGRIVIIIPSFAWNKGQ